MTNIASLFNNIFIALKRRIFLFGQNNKGIAAVEFALIAPVLLTLCFGMSEMFIRFQVTDQFNRQTYQIADILTRDSDIKTGSSDPNIGDDLKSMIEYIDNNIGNSLINKNVHLEVASIGYEINNGVPVLLWTRNINNNGSANIGTNGSGPSTTIDVNEANDLGEPLDSVLAVKLKIEATTPFSYIDKNSMLVAEKTVMLRPRISRVITINGVEAEQNTDWDVIK